MDGIPFRSNGLVAFFRAVQSTDVPVYADRDPPSTGQWMHSPWPSVSFLPERNLPVPRKTHSDSNHDANLFVCSYSTLMERISQFRPEHLVSVLGRSDCVPFPSVVGVRHLRLEIDDVFRPCSGFRPATVRNIRQLVDFVKDWKDSEHMLIHCWAGSSRSPAAALIALAVKCPGQEAVAARILRSRGPHANPNELMIAVADRVLELNGRLIKAVNDMPYRNRPQSTDLIKLSSRL
jgi:predicted protein tyrosine phosphatase